MSAFEYEAIDRDGRRQTGVVTAESARLARQELKVRKLIPLAVTPASGKAIRLPFDLTWPGRGPQMSNSDLTLMTRQLATMLGAGAPLEGALQTLVQQSEKPAVRRLVSAVRTDVTEGYPLAEALARQGNVFSPFYRALIGAGEASGSLAPVLDRLAAHLERAHHIRGKVITACVYPAALAVTALVVVAALITFVVPKVVEQFDSLSQDLPALTQFVIAVSDIASSYGLIIVALCFAAVFAAVRALAVPRVRRQVDTGLLKLPLIGRLIRDLQTARLARTLSTLISCGAPVVEGLNAACKTVQNTVLLEAIETVLRRVREGTSLSVALRATEAFPPLLIYMVAIGETSGRLDDMLAKAADHLESEFETFTATALSLLEPAIIIAMGGVVATIVLAILLPILRLNSLALM
jgi:general secretion pathway protein F